MQVFNLEHIVFAMMTLENMAWQQRPNVIPHVGVTPVKPVAALIEIVCI